MLVRYSLELFVSAFILCLMEHEVGEDTEDECARYGGKSYLTEGYGQTADFIISPAQSVCEFCGRDLSSNRQVIQRDKFFVILRRSERHTFSVFLSLKGDRKGKDLYAKLSSSLGRDIAVGITDKFNFTHRVSPSQATPFSTMYANYTQ